MASHSMYLFDFHLSHAKSELRNGQSENWGCSQVKRDLVPAEVCFFVVLSQRISDRDLRDGNTTQRDSARALHKGNTRTGTVQRQREMLSANWTDKIHWKNVTRISIHDADKNNRPGTNVEGGQSKKLTDN